VPQITRPIHSLLTAAEDIPGMWHEECLVSAPSIRTQHSRSSTSKSVTMLEPFSSAVPTREI
jgi:hypothetical protein